MDLWIRSQDKKHLMKSEAILYEKTGTGYGLRAFTKNYDFNIANYKTKERALEVLDEIQNILKPKILVRRNDNNDKVLLGALQKGVTQKIDMEFKELSTYVYEMPKE